MDAEWTLDVLVRRVAQVLAEGDVRAPNGRVTQLPDVRIVRWYATQGLVDRPSATRGRTALYGMRHLLQLVAVKRRQAEGRTLAEIRQELTGAPDDILRRVAMVPPGVAELGTMGADEVESDGVEPDPAVAQATAPGVLASAPGRTSPRQTAMGPDSFAIAAVHGVRMGAVTLLLPAVPNDDDLVAIREGAQPLLDVLADRGLLAP